MQDSLFSNAPAINPTDWDADLGALLGTLSKATAAAVARQVSDRLGGTYNADEIAPMLEAESGVAAQKINAATIRRIADKIAAAIADADTDSSANETDFVDSRLSLSKDAVNSTFDEMDATRAEQIATARASQVALSAGVLAASAAGAAYKQWVVQSGKPRASHAMVDGEQQPLGGFFSNGMLGPGDISNGGIDEVAGCNCTIVYGKDDPSSTAAGPTVG